MTTETLNAPNAASTAASSVPNILADRADFRAIARWIEPHSSVLDLGCADGSLLRVLQDELDVLAYGIEIDDAGVLATTQKGVHVIQQNLEGGLALFEDKSFDTVILSQTLQTIHNTAQVLREMLRVGRECIVSFPNFGYWPHRLSIFRGRMPVSESLPYEWYDTPNVRCATINDFRDLARECGLEVIECVALAEGKRVSFLPNLRGDLAVFRLRKK
jgi:methionine biosynthesis protein MetW